MSKVQKSLLKKRSPLEVNKTLLEVNKMFLENDKMSSKRQNTILESDKMVLKGNFSSRFPDRQMFLSNQKFPRKARKNAFCEADYLCERSKNRFLFEDRQIYFSVFRDFRNLSGKIFRTPGTMNLPFRYVNLLDKMCNLMTKNCNLITFFCNQITFPCYKLKKLEGSQTNAQPVLMFLENLVFQFSRPSGKIKQSRALSQKKSQFFRETRGVFFSIT